LIVTPPRRSSANPGAGGGLLAGCKDAPTPLEVKSDHQLLPIVGSKVSTADQAKAILEAAAARYASMKSYSDCGAVHTQLNQCDPVFSTSFSTWFKRPSFFRFSFERPHPYPPLRYVITRHIVGFDGRRAYSSTQRDGEPRIEDKQSLALAIAGATGISSGSAHTIGRLLLPEIDGISILDFLDIRLNPETAADGVACHCVSGRYPKGNATAELWIEKGSLLVRKVTTTPGSGKPPSTEVRNSIHVDEPIAETLFQLAA